MTLLVTKILQLDCQDALLKMLRVVTEFVTKSYCGDGRKLDLLIGVENGFLMVYKE